MIFWEKATDDVTAKMKENFEKEDLNPVFMMSQSGARGNINQLRHKVYFII